MQRQSSEYVDHVTRGSTTKYIKDAEAVHEDEFADALDGSVDQSVVNLYVSLGMITV